MLHQAKKQEMLTKEQETLLKAMEDMLNKRRSEK